MRLSHLVLVLCVAAVWGFNFIPIKVSLIEIPPLLLVALRFLLTSSLTLFIKRPQVPFIKIALYGLVMFALQFALMFMGIHAGVTAGLASILLQVQVFFTALFAFVLLKEKMSRWQICGGVISFSGIAFVAFNLGGEITLSGFLLVLASAVTWSLGNIISKRIGKTNMLALIIWSSLVAWPPLLVVSLYFEGPETILNSLQNLSWLSVSAVLYIVCLSTLFGYGAWNWLIQSYSLPTVAPFTLLIPVFGMLGSTLTLGEPLQSWKILAAFLVILGLCLSVLGPRFAPKRAFLPSNSVNK